MGLFGFGKKKDKGNSPDVQARIEELCSDLKSEDPKVRLAACEELLAKAEVAADAEPALLDLIDDPDGDVCLAASSALTEIQRYGN